jgi:hypothetical protein
MVEVLQAVLLTPLQLLVLLRSSTKQDREIGRMHWHIGNIVNEGM